jgi:hypothetical protein
VNTQILRRRRKLELDPKKVHLEVRG